MKNKNQPAQAADMTLKADKDCALLDFLLEKITDRSRTKVREILKSGRAVVGGTAVTAFDYQLKAGDTVRILPRPKLMREGGIGNPNLDILYEDYDVVVINKKEGLLSVGTVADKENTAYHIVNMHVKKQGRNRHIYVVHRLDRKTSGVMMFAKSVQARDFLRGDWKNVVVERSYYAVIEGVPQYRKDTIKSYLSEDKMLKIHSSFVNDGGQFAQTSYEVLADNGEFSLVKCNLDTGRKNQIRVQMSAIGHPIAGDAKYGAKTNPLKRVCLHAATLQFVHPKTGKLMKFEVPVPGGFFKTVKKIEGVV